MSEHYKFTLLTTWKNCKPTNNHLIRFFSFKKFTKFNTIQTISIYIFISTVLMPNRFFTLSLYFTKTTFDDRMFNFSPAHNNWRHVARSRKSPIFSSRKSSLLLPVDGGIDEQIYENETFSLIETNRTKKPNKHNSPA